MVQDSWQEEGGGAAAALRTLSSVLCVSSLVLAQRREATLAAVCAGGSLALAAVDLVLRLEGGGRRRRRGSGGLAGAGAGAPPVEAAARESACDGAREKRVDSDGSAAAVGGVPARRGSAGEKGVVELLVHNVSHADLVVSFGGPDDDYDEFDDDATLRARPAFSCFAAVSEELLRSARESAVLAFGRSVRRDESHAAYPVGVAESRLPCGVSLRSAEPWPAARVKNDLKVKRRPSRRLSDPAGASATMGEMVEPALVPRRVYFPLLAVLLRAWLASTAADDDDDATKERVVLLVSGAGTPRDEARDARENSTQFVAELMEVFLAKVCAGVAGFPAVRVVRLHSEANVFRYDENISFVRHELEPAVVALRQRVVGDDPQDDWADRFRVAISFADGAPARVSTIHKSLRAGPGRRNKR